MMVDSCSVLQVIFYTWLMLDISNKNLTSIGCFLLSCDGGSFVLNEYKLSAEGIDEKEKGLQPGGVCHVSDSNWAS